MGLVIKETPEDLLAFPPWMYLKRYGLTVDSSFREKEYLGGGHPSSGREYYT